MMNHLDYVVGFLFNASRRRVVLLEKRKPEWQKGKLNGVGGKIEAGESPFAAMVREFEEETGIRFERWTRFAIYQTPHNPGVSGTATIHFFRGCDDVAIGNVRTTTDEPVGVYFVGDLRGHLNMTSPLVVNPHLHWLLPLAINLELQPTPLFKIEGDFA